MVIATIIFNNALNIPTDTHNNTEIATINIPSDVSGINAQLEYAFMTAQNYDGHTVGNAGWESDPDADVTLCPNVKEPRSMMVGDHITISYPTTPTTTTFEVLPNGFDIVPENKELCQTIADELTNRLKPHAVSLLQRVSSVCQQCVSRLES